MSTGSAARNVVLVHGGFVDGSGWQSVYGILTKDGYNVSVVQNPTLSLEGDAAANLFKDDEMIPISASQWDDEVSGEPVEGGKSPSIKPPGGRKNPDGPGKRSSKLPPARAKA